MRVIDGDTLGLSGRNGTPEFIRIANKNAPEKGQFGYSAAKRRLAQQTLGRTMTFDPVAFSYGRTVAKMPGLNRRLPPKGR